MTSTLTRLGLWGLPLAGVLIGVFWFVQPGGDRALASDPDAYVQGLTSAGATVAGYAYLVGLVCLLFGLLALYRLVADGPAAAWAVVGPLVGVAAIALLLPLMGVLVVANPVIGDVYQAGHRDVVEALKPLAGGSGGPRIVGHAVVAIMLALIAAIATGLALWRSGRVPRWAGVVFALGFFLCILTTPIVTPIGALLVLLSGAWLAWTLREAAGADRGYPAGGGLLGA